MRIGINGEIITGKGYGGKDVFIDFANSSGNIESVLESVLEVASIEQIYSMLTVEQVVGLIVMSDKNMVVQRKLKESR